MIYGSGKIFQLHSFRNARQKVIKALTTSKNIRMKNCSQNRKIPVRMIAPSITQGNGPHKQE